MHSASLPFWVAFRQRAFCLYRSPSSSSTSIFESRLLDRMQHRSARSTSSLEEGALLRDSQEPGVSSAVGMFASSHKAFRDGDLQVNSPYARGQLFHPSSSTQFGRLTSLGIDAGQIQGASPVSVALNAVLPQNTTPAHLGDSSVTAAARQVSASLKAAHDGEDEHEAYSSSDSDVPLELSFRSRQLKCSSSPPTLSARALIGDSENQEAFEMAEDAAHPNIKHEEEEEIVFDPAPVVTIPAPLIDSNKYQADIDWIDECDRCIKMGLRCYSAAGTRLDNKRCEDCNQHHRCCIVDGVNVTQRHPQSRLKHKKTTSAPKASSARRKSRRKINPSQQAPVILTTASGTQARSDARKLRRNHSEKKRISKPTTQTKIQGRHLSDSSPISSAPASDSEDQVASNPTEVPAPEQSEPISSKACMFKMGLPDAQQIEAGTVAQPTVDVTNVKQPQKPEITLTQAADMRLERYTMGLIKDIANAIRRCQDRVEKMPEETGLRYLENTVTVLLGDLSKLLKSDLDGSNPTHWIVPQLAEYLEGIRSECQLAKEATEGQKNDAERQARRVAAIFGSDLPFERCLTLISMHVEESPTKTTPH
ncbi:uncharacterized protein UTRI_00059 [Ustilago trichophora]|uniref:Uncharacterized protein n=1 Tax=Ustilago trichophora TaxID=86804 RepID=A0A5C3DQD4_9BASI|nr:uncharacterized protein UTRI_00059 [Ustilago trichophora]